ncbi:MAG: hypothetical protein GEV08_05655 [Acidimicrobiia bacterium]|nr:hypothetical protein [Acidimicrobiia bacterium]
MEQTSTTRPSALDGVRRGGWPLLVLGAWSVLTWAGRIRNIVEDAELSGGERAAWLVPAVVFIAGGVLVLVAWRRGGGRALRPAVRAFALWTIGYWALRTVLLVGNGHSAGFVAVHAVLAVVAGGLAAAVLVHLRQTASGRQGLGMPTAGAAR